MGLMCVVHLVMDLEVNGSNPGGVKYYSCRLSFERNSSDISGFVSIWSQRGQLRLFAFQLARLVVLIAPIVSYYWPSLGFYFVVKIFVTTIWRRSLQVCFLFMRSCNFHNLAAWRCFSRNFLSFLVMNFVVIRDLLTLKNDFLAFKLTSSYLNSRR